MLEDLPRQLKTPALDALLLKVYGGLLLSEIGANPAVATYDKNGMLELEGVREVGRVG